jgi:hypothetical protein
LHEKRFEILKGRARCSTSCDVTMSVIIYAKLMRIIFIVERINGLLDEIMLQSEVWLEKIASATLL